MKIALFLLIVCLTVNILPQEIGQSDYTIDEIDSAAGHFLRDNYTRYVGGGEKNYPLTVAGLQTAIASLDSGIVYISHPGLWDTTGLGTIPNKISINGWLFGCMVHTLSDVTNLYQKYVWSDRPGAVDPAYTGSNLPYSPFVFVGRQISFDATVSTYSILDRNLPTIKIANKYLMASYNLVAVDTSYHGGVGTIGGLFGSKSHITFNSDSTASNLNGSSIRAATNQLDYLQKYQTLPFWDITATYSRLWFKTGCDTVSSTSINGNWFDLTDNSGVIFNSNIYGFRSSIATTVQAKLLTGKVAYHFYGENNYPAWFGGTVNSGAGYNYAADTSSTDAYKIVLAGAHALTAGLEVTFKTLHANTDGATLTVNSLTAKAITKAASGAVNTTLATGDILAGQIVKAVYDGTQFQVISRLAQ